MNWIYNLIWASLPIKTITYPSPSLQGSQGSSTSLSSAKVSSSVEDGDGLVTEGEETLCYKKVPSVHQWEKAMYLQKSWMTDSRSWPLMDPSLFQSSLLYQPSFDLYILFSAPLWVRELLISCDIYLWFYSLIEEPGNLLKCCKSTHKLIFNWTFIAYIYGKPGKSLWFTSWFSIYFYICQLDTLCRPLCRALVWQNVPGWDVTRAPIGCDIEFKKSIID